MTVPLGLVTLITPDEPLATTAVIVVAFTTVNEAAAVPFRTDLAFVGKTLPEFIQIFFACQIRDQFKTFLFDLIELALMVSGEIFYIKSSGSGVARGNVSPPSHRPTFKPKTRKPALVLLAFIAFVAFIFIIESTMVIYYTFYYKFLVLFNFMNMVKRVL